MEMLSKRRPSESRTPITITLDAVSYDFVESCASLKQFRSIDDFFESALAIFKNHLEAWSAYVELQKAKGMTLEEIISSAECEIVFTRHRD
jgi:hypothetical protein